MADMRSLLGGTVFGAELTQASFQKLGGCAVLREGRGAGVEMCVGVVGGVGSGDSIEL